MMLMTKITLFFCIVRLLRAEAVDKQLEERTFIKGFPGSIPCSDGADIPYEGSFYGGEEEGGEYSDDYPEGDGYSNQEESNSPANEDEVMCTIKRNEVVIYNETIVWANSGTRGVFQDVEAEWSDSVVVIELAWGEGKTISYGFRIILKSPDQDVCVESDSAQRKITVDIGHTQILDCQGDVGRQLTEEQLRSISVSWWKGCEKIEQNSSFIDEYDEQNPFGSLKIENASLLSHPGEYRCVLEKQTENGTIRHVHKLQKICLQRPYDFTNEPTIKPSSAEYIVSPGENLTIIATGETGTDPTSLSLSVALEKQTAPGEWEEICEAHEQGQKRSSLQCTFNVHENEEYCNILTEEEVAAVEQHRLGDNFTAVFYISEVTEGDEGIYRLSIRTTKNIPFATISVKVQYPPGTPKWLVITLSLVGVLVVIAMVVLILLHVYSIEIHYFTKKVFGVEMQVTRPMCYLLYYPDATEGDDPVDAVRRFIAGRRFFDDNNVNGAPDLNAAGHLLADHRVHLLRQCMSLVIFVTPAMLRDNDIEIFVAYRGFEENIQNELPIVFITTPETRNTFNRASNDENPTVAAFREFMKRGKNKVIHWDHRHPNRFRRALYAFLPKVAYPGVQQQENMV